MITIYLKQYNKIIRNADTKLFDELGYDDILWIDMLLPTIKEQKAVENFMEISLQTKQQVEEIESTSKYSENENAIISNSNFFVPTGDSFIVEPVSFIISNEGVLVSVRSAEFRTFRETEKRLQMNYRSYSTGYHLFISLLEVRIDFDADLVELISKQVSALSKDVNSEDSIDKEVLHRISALQESTMLLRENIFDRQRVLSGILRSERFPNDIYPRLQLMIKDVNSLINHADFSFQRLDYIQDAALGLINIEQNGIVKIFSVAAVIFMPATLILSHVILKELAVIRREGQVMTYLRPDAKSQVTIEYDEQTHRPLRVHTIVVSTQHDDFIPTSKGVTEKMAEKRMQEKIREDVRTILIPRVKARLERAGDQLAELIGDDYILHVNPTGKFVIGGPHGDTGLTGRKIIVDSYGGRGAHGGGAFSGKDSSKVDRSAAYAARYIAKNLVAAGLCRKCQIELAYAIGVAHPVSVLVDTYGTGVLDEEKLSAIVNECFDMRPAKIIEHLNLRRPIYEQTAAYGHFGRTDVDLPWEHTDKVNALKGAAGIK